MDIKEKEFLDKIIDNIEKNSKKINYIFEKNNLYSKQKEWILNNLDVESQASTDNTENNAKAQETKNDKIKSLLPWIKFINISLN